MSEIGLFEAMYSARALRRLKPDPVPEKIITKILDAAIRAIVGEKPIRICGVPPRIWFRI